MGTVTLNDEQKSKLYEFVKMGAPKKVLLQVFDLQPELLLEYMMSSANTSGCTINAPSFNGMLSLWKKATHIHPCQNLLAKDMYSFCDERWEHRLLAATADWALEISEFNFDPIDAIIGTEPLTKSPYYSFLESLMGYGSVKRFCNYRQEMATFLGLVLGTEQEPNSPKEFRGQFAQFILHRLTLGTWGVYIGSRDIEFIDAKLATLTEREAEVLRIRYGLPNGQPKTLDETAARFGISRERLRQIEAKTIAKMRHSTRLGKWFPAFLEKGVHGLLVELDNNAAWREQTIKALEQRFTSSAAGELITNLSQEVENLQGQVRALEAQISQYPKAFTALGMSVNDLETSVRAYNVLVRANIKTVRELAELTEDQLSTMKNCGRRTVEELKELLAAHGLRLGMRFDQNGFPIPEQAPTYPAREMAITIDETLGFSVHSIQCLKELGIENTWALAQLSENHILSAKYGKGTLQEVKAVFADLGLTFQMVVDPKGRLHPPEEYDHHWDETE